MDYLTVNKLVSWYVGKLEMKAVMLLMVELSHNWLEIHLI